MYKSSKINFLQFFCRYRAGIFYVVIVIENFSFVALFYYVNNLKAGMEFSYWISVAAALIVLVGKKERKNPAVVAELADASAYSIVQY